MFVERGDDRARADREVHQRLEREDGRQLGQPVLARVARNLVLERARQPGRLPRTVDREGVVLERIEFGRHAEPRRPRKAREDRRPAEHPGESRHLGDPDHRRDQDDAVGTGELGVAECVERVLHRQRPAVGEPDQMQRARRADAAAGLPHRESGGFRPVLPIDAGERARHGAMSRQPDRDGDKAARPVHAGDVAQAVRGIGQSVQQDDRADRRPVRLQHVGAIPVGREPARINRAAVEVAIDRNPLFRRQLVRDLGPHLTEDRASALR